MDYQNKTYFNDDDRNRLIILVILLILLFSVTSFAAGFMIGRTNHHSDVRYTGRIIDTITLFPRRSEKGWFYEQENYVLDNEYSDVQNAERQEMNLDTEQNSKNADEKIVSSTDLEGSQNNPAFFEKEPSDRPLDPSQPVEESPKSSESTELNFKIKSAPNNTRKTSPSNREPSLTVSDTIQTNRYWKQSTPVQIFADRPGNIGVKIINGKTVIAPGAKGSYVFKIQNFEPYRIKYKLSLIDSDENNPKLPIRYRLKEGISGEHYVEDDEWKAAKEIIVENATIKSGGERYYTLEWKWDSKDSVLNTQIGTQEGSPTYMLEIVVYGEFE